MPHPHYFRRILMALALICSALAQADNPIIKERFSADPAALVHDGKVYLYVGHDEATQEGDFFVLKEWNIYSSSDLKNWTLEGAVPRTIFEWAEADSAWASQAIEHDGKFYWYTTVRMPAPEEGDGLGGYTLGVAVSDNPVSGWKDALGEPLIDPNDTQPPQAMLEHNHSWDDIDPTVFVDHDGQAHLYWGNTHLYHAKLKGNMIELDGPVHRITIEDMPGTFTEAPWLHEYQGTYYLTFAMNYPEELAYATSDNPEGPWQYRGKLMDTIEDSGTSHQAILEYKGEDYFIYHTAALPTGGNYRRSVSMEHLNYNADGSIQKITPTASGITHSAQALQSHANADEYLRYSDGEETNVTQLNADHHWQFKWHLKPLVKQDGNTVSFQPETRMGYYLVAQDGELVIAEHDGTDAFARKATFEQVSGLADSDWSSYRAIDHKNLYLMVKEGQLTLGNPSTPAEREAATFQPTPVE